ncbi:hypothetical protein Tco_0813120 [Tanacetum coccineum]
MPSISSLPPFMECGVGDRLVTLVSLGDDDDFVFKGTKGPETMCTRFIYEFPIFDKMKGVRELLEGLIPYSQRHYIVIDRFERSTLLLLDDPDVEAVYAPLPTSLHLQWGGDTGCVSQSDWSAVIVINHYQAPQITAGQSGCDTQSDVPTLTFARLAHHRAGPGAVHAKVIGAITIKSGNKGGAKVIGAITIKSGNKGGGGWLVIYVVVMDLRLC